MNAEELSRISMYWGSNMDPLRLGIIIGLIVLALTATALVMVLVV